MTHSGVLGGLQLFIVTLDQGQDSHLFPPRPQKTGHLTECIGSRRAG